MLTALGGRSPILVVSPPSSNASPARMNIRALATRGTLKDMIVALN